MRHSILAIAACAAMALVGTATADEVWTTEIGDVIYETDLPNGQAVWSYPLEDSDWRGRVFLPGLAGQYQDRASYSGYWIEPGASAGEAACEVELRDPETEGTSDVWGRVMLIFVDDSTWVAMRSQCFDDPDEEMLVGRLKVVEGAE